MQTMQVEVFDQSYVTTSFLGHFQVDLGDIFLNTSQSNQKRLDKIKKVKDEILEQFGSICEQQENVLQIHN